MNLTLPAKATRVTAATLEKMVPSDTSVAGRPIYRFTGDTVISGRDASGKEIDVSKGSLWIIGNTQDFDANLTLGKTLHINGNVNGCSLLTASDIVINGQVTFGGCSPGIISATRGDLRIKGSVTGQQESRETADEVYREYSSWSNNTATEQAFFALDKIHAVGNVTVGGTVENVGIGTQEGGRITTGARKGWIITKNPDGPHTIANMPDQFRASFGAGIV